MGFHQQRRCKIQDFEFRPVLRNLSYKESFVFCMYENKNGRKWIANSLGRIYEVIRDSAFIVPGTEAVSEKLSFLFWFFLIDLTPL